MNGNIYIKKIYENTLYDFLENCSQEDKEKLRDLYFRYLVREYSKIELSDQNVQYYSELEKVKWKNFSIEGKLSIIIEDKALDRLISLSLEAQKFASEYVNNNVMLDKIVASQKIEEMDKLLNNVNEFNKDLANYYYSEGSIDFSFSAGLTDLMSLRTGRLYSTKNYSNS